MNACPRRKAYERRSDDHHEHWDKNHKKLRNKGLRGPRGFDYANIFPNPPPASRNRGRFTQRLRQVAALSGLGIADLAAWTMAWTALSGIWSAEDGNAAAAKSAFGFSILARKALEAAGGPLA